MKEMIEILKNYNVKENIFLKKGYLIRCIENYEPFELHEIDNITLKYENMTATLSFEKKDYVLAFVIFSSMTTNPYGVDNGWTAEFNNLKWNIEKNTETSLQNLINHTSLLTTNNNLKIYFSEPKTWEYHAQNLYFLITPDYDDYYFCRKEAERREGFVKK